MDPASLPNGLNERARMVTSTIEKEVRLGPFHYICR
jgi:hypothetical protein